ncbi:RING-H2 finger protein ATL65-like protein [Carex littledalei]|uniref:RING-type E3 ubiquitin transferase n=1 Tax=Carex littledalei TaxID=544730 RepID=A0A833RC39_9POAL|nr:RING-H2 finger protein ATL65-like protein [Carex littledalei]
MRELPATSPSPSPSPLPFSSPPHATIDLSPPLIAMVVVVGTAFLIVLYTRVISQLFRRLYRRFRLWRRRRRLLLFSAPSPMTRHDPTGATTISFGSSSDYFIFSPYGLDDSSIKSLPTSFFSKSKAKHLACTNRDCAVCLLEFEDNDYIRTLPYCSHAFHVECIDVWLRSHATCPLCRASVIRPELNYSYSPFVPMRASRIRPSLDEFFLCPPQDLLQIHLQRESISEFDPEIEIVPANATSISPPTSSSSNFMLKRSYSFGFERNLANERMVLEPSTASPWRFRQHHRNSNSFWSKRWPSPSPFQGSASASRSSRVFSFRSYRAIKSPFNRRRTDSSIRLGHGPGLSARRARSMTMGFYSSRMRCGDPEALLSPERLNNR